MKKKIIGVAITISLLILTTVALALLFTPDKGKDSSPSPLEMVNNLFNSNECTDENTTFTYPPTDLENLTSITPLGNLNPSGHTFPTRHMYYSVIQEDPEDQNSPTIAAPLYAPITATIESISISTLLSDDPPTTDYSLNFRTCEDFTFYYIHVTSLSDKITEQFEYSEDDCSFSSPGGSDYKQCWIEAYIDVEAGEVIGTVGSAYRGNFDFGVTDFRIEPHVVANASRWDNFDDHRYVVCSTDYYKGELQEQLEALLAGWNGPPRTVEPLCGTIEHDLPGTAQGVWFQEGFNGRDGEETGMALVHGNGDPTQGVFSIGTGATSAGIPSNTYYFTPRMSGNINTDFDLITPGNTIYCYENRHFYEYDKLFSLLIQLTDKNTLVIGTNADTSCNTIPDSITNGVKFER